MIAIGVKCIQRKQQFSCLYVSSSVNRYRIDLLKLLKRRLCRNTKITILLFGIVAESFKSLLKC